ncbi:hypothetical protein DPMN_046671 [Dreissena polymorpha]|uniref:Uncharacterized protein n=1 Tax=Dreissena polymorpha TaxID=45954 RepID=A0A9D4D8A8_DREPO|nr:hypothetical protein DPMN_046671 [Dreissena polymorpha]
MKDEKSGDKLSKFLKEVPSEPQIDKDGLCTFDFRSHTIKDGATQRQEARSVCVKFVENMLKSLNERFSDNDDSANLTALTNFFSPQINDHELDSEINTLFDYLTSFGHEGTQQELKTCFKILQGQFFKWQQVC